MKLQRPIIGYTLGDQAGIGPEVTAAALKQLREDKHVEYRLIGQHISCTPGQPTDTTALTALEHLEMAAEDLREGRIDAVVTAPVSKENLHRVGFTFPGQTEFFAARLGVENFAMCLTGRHLTAVLCTTHIALTEVPQVLQSKEIVRVGCLLAHFLRSTGLQHPRLAIAGLNPHNGESGAFGDEEQRIILPSVVQLKNDLPWAEISGPCVPDCVYRAAAYGEYDGIVAPYHDQALIPLKLLDFDNAVNATLGLPRLRVSPDHGTAFNIAGKGIAGYSSTLRAFEVARRSIR